MRFTEQKLKRVGKGAKYLSLFILAFLLSFLVSSKSQTGAKGWYSDLSFTPPHAQADVIGGPDGGSGSCSTGSACPDGGCGPDSG